MVNGQVASGMQLVEVPLSSWIQSASSNSQSSTLQYELLASCW